MYKYIYILDSGVNGLVLPSLSGTPLPYDTIAPASEHTITVLATDEANNIETAVHSWNASSHSYQSFNRYTWSIDDRAPITTITSGTPPLYSAALQYTFTFASDESGGHFNLVLSTEEDSETPRIVEYITISVDPLLGSVILPDALKQSRFADGVYTLSITAVDLAGNLGNTVTETWQIDSRPPRVVIMNPGPSDAFATTRSTGLYLLYVIYI